MPTYQEWLADQNKQRTAAQQQFTQAQGRYNQNPNMPMQTSGGGLSLGSTYQSGGTPNMAAYNTMEQARGNLAALDPNSAASQAAGNKYQAYDLAHGGIDRITNDPTDQFIRQALQTAAGPDGGPFNSTTRNAMFTNAMESSGADAQAQSIMESAAQRGLSPNDPSVQAALRRTQGDQAKAGQRARLGIDLQANPANYAAQQSAVNRLGDYNTGKQQQTQSAEDRLREMLWNEGQNRQTAGPQVASAGGGMTIGGPAQSTQPAQPQSSGPWQGFSNAGSGGSGWVAPKQVTGGAPAVQQPTSAPRPPPTGTGQWTMSGPAATLTGQYQQPQIAGMGFRNTNPKLGPVATPY